MKAHMQISLFRLGVSIIPAFPLGMSLLLQAPANIPAQTYTVLHCFAGSDGTFPSRMVMSGATLYGVTVAGGVSNQGTLFRVNTDGNAFTVLKSFTGDGDGGCPSGALLSGTTLYGTADCGGLGGGPGGGTIFKLNTDGTGFQVLHSFTYWGDAFSPVAGLVMSGTTLYGTTEESASGNYGTVFELNTDGSGYQILRSLSGTDGGGPWGELLLSGSTLFGTTTWSVCSNNGTIFKLNTDGSGFTVLKAVDSVDGNPIGLYSPLVLTNSTLYGTACEQNFYGTVFKINTDGTGFTVLRTITNAGGAWAPPGLVGPVLVGDTLYATASGSDAAHGEYGTNWGTVFQMNTDGSGYSVLKNFSFADGASPQATLLFSEGTLYGTTTCGGISNKGVVFALRLPPPMILAAPQSQTAEIGSAVTFGVRTSAGSANYQWSFNGQPLAGCTNSSLLLPSVQPSNAGVYSVIVTYGAGSATNPPPAMLSVIPPVPKNTVPAISLTGDAGSFLHLIWASTPGPDADWQELDVITLSSTQQFYPDLTLPLTSSRFYRAWQGNAPSARPALQMRFGTELTLTGAIGNHVRIDRINQYGPTDAWVTLDTVTLTNTTQGYFDFTMFHQPPRLYRVQSVP
jgi:uncharacterized repeat protein (TIGR03803 family)